MRVLSGAVGLPLHGRRIVVTRAREQSADLIERLRVLGAQPLEYPSISISPLQDTAILDSAVSRLNTYDWVIFTSVNGVRAVTDRMSMLGIDPTELCGRKLGVIGPATRLAVEALGCKPDFMPDTYVAEAVIEQISDVEGKKILLPRADIARKALATGLRMRGAEVDEVVAYNTVHGEALGSLLELLHAGTVDAVTFTSSSTVRYLIEGLAAGELGDARALELLRRTQIVCIGPITAATAHEYGLDVAAVAESYTTDGLIDALIKLYAEAGEE